MKLYAVSVDESGSCDTPPPLSPSDQEGLGLSDSSCHRALRCAEVLENVLEEFNSCDLNDKRNFFLDVALVCKAFLDPAMAVLWRELPHLSPLYRVLIPDDVLKTLTACWISQPDVASQLEMQMTRSIPSPGSGRWARFMHYAAYVRRVLSIELNGFETELFRHLAGRNNSRSVLPSLQIFKCEIPRHQTAYLHSLLLFSSPTVHTLELVSSDSCIVFLDPAGSPHHSLTGAIAQAFPSLFSLDVDLRDPPPEDVLEFTTGLAALKQLCKLKLQWPGCALEPHHLRMLTSGLPHLASLSTHINGFSDAHAKQLDRVLAPSLRRLKCGGTWDDIVRLPHALECPALDELRLALHRPSTSTLLEALCECVRAISGQVFAPRLRLLGIFATAAGLARDYAAGAAQAPQRRSIADILAPLAALESLEDLTFEIVYPRGAMLLVPLCSDDNMRTVAAALRRAGRVSLAVRQDPNMPRLYGRTQSSESPSTPTLHSLVHFVTMCPQLTSLALAPVVVPPLMLMIACKGMPTCSAPNLRELHLNADGQATPTNASRSLAIYLDKLFPNLEISACRLDSDIKDALRDARKSRVA
ncbi:hypothetical protein TRAPUB_12784 [Trametes pubescens]|uniref:F-box domain-containing protein n=1 Tax=Trametes pubescens TaxID=154538 RepID=A0A1M2VSV6_TRAPU|nr:hypothetical protein TRAPUB_12784 [Trametes pubescens]